MCGKSTEEAPVAEALLQKRCGIGRRLPLRSDPRWPAGEDAAHFGAEAVEFIHTGSLIVDDIEDGSLVRRGRLPAGAKVQVTDLDPQAPHSAEDNVAADPGAQRPTISTHVLDLATGDPAPGIDVALFRLDPDGKVVAVIGDGALTGGMAWEALNNIAIAETSRLVIVVNDNGRSYMPTVGGLANHLTSLRTNPRYEQVLDAVKTRLNGVRGVGPAVYDALRLCSQLRSLERTRNVPILAMMARNPFFPPNVEESFRMLAPKMEFYMWDSVGHFLHMERPQEFNQAVLTFLEKNGLMK